MSADNIQPPGLDTRFCPACGGRDLEFITAEELKAEDGESFKESDYFIADGKVAWWCNGCHFESGLGMGGGIPTLRHLLQEDWWGCGDDVNIGRLVRWAVAAMRDKRQGVPGDFGHRYRCECGVERLVTYKMTIDCPRCGRRMELVESDKSPTTGSLPSASASTTTHEHRWIQRGLGLGFYCADCGADLDDEPEDDDRRGGEESGKLADSGLEAVSAADCSECAGLGFDGAGCGTCGRFAGGFEP